METCFSRPLVQDGLTHVHRLVSWDELRRRGFTWDDLVSLQFRFHVVWLSRDVFVYYYDDESNSVNQKLLNQEEYEEYTCLFTLSVSRENEVPFCDEIRICSVTPDVEPTRECQELFQLIGLKPTARVILSHGDERFYVEVEGEDDEPKVFARLPVSPETLACLLDNSGSREWLSFAYLFLSQEQCQQLAWFRGSISFRGCSFADHGRSISESVGCDRVGLSIVDTRIDVRPLCNALDVTTELHTLHMLSVPGFFPQCLQSLERNTSLVRLSFRPDVADCFTDKEWSDLFRAFQKHETLECLKFVDFSSDLEDTDSAGTARSQVILEMLKRHNKVLEQIEIEPADLVDQHTFDEQIQPHLTANLYRRRIKALVEKPEGCDQHQLFSRGLTQTGVNRNPSSMFMLLYDLLSEVYRASATQDEDTAPAYGTRSRKKRSSSALDYDVSTKKPKPK